MAVGAPISIMPIIPMIVSIAIIWRVATCVISIRIAIIAIIWIAGGCA
jgi:hypothetical protein